MKVIIGVTHVTIETHCKDIVSEEFSTQPLFVKDRIYNDGKKRYNEVKRRLPKLEVTI